MTRFILIVIVLAFFWLIFTQRANAQDYVNAFTDIQEDEIETGWLICVGENDRHVLANHGFPNEAIFYWHDKETGENKWCVIWKDNTAEVITEGLRTIINVLAETTGVSKYPVECDAQGNAKLIRDTQQTSARWSNNGKTVNGKRHGKPREATNECKDWLDAFIAMWDVDNVQAWPAGTKR